VADAPVRDRLRTWGLAAWHFVAGAPLTYLWLVALSITTLIQFGLTGSQLHSVVLHKSTNIYMLWTDPLGVLFSSLFWIDGRHLESYLLLFTLFLAPAEHWLGQLRWLTVGLTTHILATYFSEGLVYLAIERHDATERLVHAKDIGVSYFLVGVMAVLAYHIARPWRWPYLAVLFVIFGFPLITMDRVELDFTAIGHFASILIGLSFYSLVRERESKHWSPARVKVAYRRSKSSDTSA
jgi:hypothetical protein